MQLKYGCNPNQKPSRIFMADGSELPIEVLNGKPGYMIWANFLLWLAHMQEQEALTECHPTAISSLFPTCATFAPQR